MWQLYKRVKIFKISKIYIKKYKTCRSCIPQMKPRKANNYNRNYNINISYFNNDNNCKYN